MTRPVLDIAREAAHIVGLRAPTTLRGAQEPTDQALLALLHQAGPQLAGITGPFYESWPGLTKQSEIITVPNQTDYLLPLDFVTMIESTVWDQTTTWPAAGPLTPREWQAVTYGLVGAGTLTPLYRVRIANDGSGQRVFSIHPTPTDVAHLPFEYRSRYWIRPDTSHEANSDTINYDTDIPIFPAHLLILDLVWRWRKSRGLPFAADLGDFEHERDRLFGEIAGYQRIRLTGPRTRVPTLRIPETGYGPSE